ncbi:glycoside-pentoside-hexuronide (GPH):cation symporter [Paenibacillus oryzisoli]|uniref:MFS transporter n=1 Tax=Paenibacillus oryzisoli TaxID=1850517 RepID=UPI003D26F2FF
MNTAPEIKFGQAATTATDIRNFGLRDQIGYLFGDFGNDFFFILVSSFLMVYYTDIFHISAGTVGLLFLIARVWDAVADITWGRFIDTRKPSRHGKFKPWILRMSFPLVISGVLMFIHIPGMSGGFYLPYAFVTYILWGTLYSTVNIPYGSMASFITGDPVERTSLSTFRTMGAIFASLIVNVAGPLILFVNNKADANHFMLGALLFGLLSISCYIACYKLSTERIQSTEAQLAQMNLKTTLKGMGRNKPLLSILLISLLFLMLTMLTGAVNVYLYKNYFGSASMLSLVGLLQAVIILIAIPLAKPLVARFGKKEIAASGMLLAGAVYLLLAAFPGISVTGFVALSSVGTLGMAFFNLVVWAFVTDVIDYHEVVTGLREDGTVYSVYSFARKLGQAIAGGIGGFALGAVGYNAAAQTQTQAALDGIYRLCTLVPGIVYLILFLLLVFTYPLNKQRTLAMTAELASKRHQA